MRVLIAFDKFKGALGAEGACAVARDTLARIRPDWECDVCPIADGGEGLVEILARAAGGSIGHVDVTGPRGKKVTAAFGQVAWENVSPAARQLLLLPPPPRPDAPLFLVEMSAASGLALLDPEERNPWLASTQGTGELLQHAANAGAFAIVVGLGGSATHDLGCGALGALGLQFFDAEGNRFPLPTPGTWAALKSIGGNLPRGFPPLRLACDVTNPVLGPQGAAATYGPQKGLAEGDLARLDRDSEHTARLLCHHFDQPLARASEPGSGAAGGIAFGLRTALGAELVPGFSLVAAWIKLAERLRRADLVLTGEGRFDATSAQGKAAGAIVELAKIAGNPTHVFAGKVDQAVSTAALTTHEISPRSLPLPEALLQTAENLARALELTFPTA